MQISTIGIDLAKNVFQVHGVDATGKVSITKQLRRGQVLAFFAQIAAVPHRHGSVCDGPPLGTRAQEARPRCAADAGELREGVRQARQERCCRCCGNL